MKIQTLLPNSNLLEYRIYVSIQFARVLDGECPPVDLELTLAGVTVRDSVVDCAAGVSQQVQSLPGTPHHAQVQLAVEEQRLNRRDAGPTILSQRGNHHQPVAVQPLLAQSGHLGVLPRELFPGHAESSNHRKTRGVSRGFSSSSNLGEQKLIHRTFNHGQLTGPKFRGEVLAQNAPCLLI